MNNNFVEDQINSLKEFSGFGKCFVLEKQKNPQKQKRRRKTKNSGKSLDETLNVIEIRIFLQCFVFLYFFFVFFLHFLNLLLLFFFVARDDFFFMNIVSINNDLLIICNFFLFLLLYTFTFPLSVFFILYFYVFFVFWLKMNPKKEKWNIFICFLNELRFFLFWWKNYNFCRFPDFLLLHLSVFWWKCHLKLIREKTNSIQMIVLFVFFFVVAKKIFIVLLFP